MSTPSWRKFVGQRVRLKDNHQLAGQLGKIAIKWPQDDDMWEIELDRGGSCRAKKGTFEPISTDSGASPVGNQPSAE